jgi:hypothetical protein
MKKLLIVLSLVLVPLCVYATAQIPDIIMIDGVEYDLFTNPLEVLLERRPEIREKISKNINEKKGIISTALWRGYIAKFVIKENKLFLEDLFIQIRGTEKYTTEYLSIVNDIFETDTSRVCDFYTGVLLIPYGKMLEYVHMGYSSIYENYKIITILEGEVKVFKEFTYEEYVKNRDKAFEIYKATEEYQKMKKELLDRGWVLEDIDRFLYSYEIQYFIDYLVNIN